jgi:4-hydroxybenzoate polyprenyltransferase
MTGRVALRLGRVSNLPTVWTNVAAGVVLAGGALEPLPVALLIVALSLFYVGGMYLNDAFDHEIDAVERPERPIPSGQVSAATVFTAGFALLALGELVLAVAALGLQEGRVWPPVVSGAALAAAIVYYDARHKTDPWSPVVMGVCRVLVYVTAAVAVAPALPRPVLAGAAVLLAYLIGLTYVAKQETLTRVENAWPLLFLAVPAVYAARAALASPVAAAIYAGFLAWVGYAVSGLLRRGRPDIGGAVVRLIAGISLVDALLIAGQGRDGPALVAVAAVPLTRLLQRYVPGT